MRSKRHMLQMYQNLYLWHRNESSKNTMRMQARETLLGKSLPELEDFCRRLDFPRYTARQIAQWIYGKRVKDIGLMSNLSAKNRQTLQEHAVIGCAPPEKCQVSQDGTEKYLFATPMAEPGEQPASQSIESVFIPEENRATLCLSSQSGCRMNCAFCATGNQGFNHNLLPNEILNQYYSLPHAGQISNIVYMGMGEPFDNTDSVLASLSALTSEWGFAWSPYRITVSTAGVIPGMRRFLDESLCHLAVSLHNPFPEEREQLVPAEKAYPVKEVIRILQQYPWHKQRRVSFEYILMKGCNDTPLHARSTARLLQGLKCRVNLIPCHEIPGKPFRKSRAEDALRFQEILQRHGIICTLRKSRGEDIMAACGLLANTGKSNKETGTGRKP